MQIRLFADFSLRKSLPINCRRTRTPTDVTDAGAKTSFKNGVLEVHLKKARAVPKSRIGIE